MAFQSPGRNRLQQNGSKRLYNKVDLLFKAFLGLITLLATVTAQDIFQSIRVWDTTPEVIKIIADQGIPLDHTVGKPGIFLDITVSEKETVALLSAGLDIEILIPNLTRYYQDMNRPAIERDFPLGSMQGNYTLDELNDRFDELLTQYSAIITDRLIIGESMDGNDIWAFKVSDNPNEDEEEPEILYTGLTHAREPLGMMNLFYFVQLLCEQYGTDPEITYLVDHREMWFIPVINPDGYLYNESIQQNGGGMHRKNRRDTNCGDGTSRGVDLNRNYGYGWGANNTGSSPDPCSATYRGTEEFSEPETAAIRDFVEDRAFMNVLHYHAYSNVLIHPYGNASLPEEPDLTTYREVGEEMTRYNGYAVGTGYELIGYTVNGDAVDWSYGDQGLIAYVPEVGSSSQGFWPPEDHVEVLCQDQVYPNKIFAFVSGSDYIVGDVNITDDVIEPGGVATLEIEIQNRGLTDSDGPVQVLLQVLNDHILLPDSAIVIDDIPTRESEIILIEPSISPETVVGTETGLIVSVHDNISFQRSDTIRFLVGQPSILFFDGFEAGLDNWSVNGDWGLTTASAAGDHALTDSPDGDYGSGQTTVAELNVNFGFEFIAHPIVSFKAQWEIEENWDFVRFQAFVPLGDGWISLAGDYTEMGSGQPAQPDGEPGYDGVQGDWVQETIQLDQLNGQNPTAFRFIQTSDNYQEGDGFSLDDFTIFGYPQALQGDFIPDGTVNIFDVLGLADLILFEEEPSDYQLFFSDLDNNNVLNVMDLVLLVNIILGI